jgi:branched-chain amino acid transport system substrate-binding protein
MASRTNTVSKLFALAVALLLASLAVAACGDDDDDGGGGGGEGDSGEPIVVGISAAKSGALEPYDRQGAQMLQMRLEEINDEGGVLGGRKFEVEWLDTESDRPRAGTNARQLIDDGADVIIATCDFDFAFPALQAAMESEVLGMALCASAPIVANPDTVGQTGGSMGQGADAEGVAMANFLSKEHPDMQSAYIFTDTFLQYNKETSSYFKAQWQELGGEICGEDDFVGDESLNLAPHITRLRGIVDQCDVIYVGSIVPAGAQLVRAAREAGIDTTFATNVAVNGTTVREVAGRVSGLYSMSHTCLPSYCDGAGEDVVDIADKFEQRWGSEPVESYSIVPYDLGTAIAEGIEKAGSTEGTEVADALFNQDLAIDTVVPPGRKQFSPECHRPQPAEFSIELWENGQASQVGTAPVDSIPDTGDPNTCRDVPPAPE